MSPYQRTGHAPGPPAQAEPEVIVVSPDAYLLCRGCTRRVLTLYLVAPSRYRCEDCAPREIIQAKRRT